MRFTNEPPHDKTNKMACAPSEDLADGQDDLSLRWAHMPFVDFVTNICIKQIMHSFCVYIQSLTTASGSRLFGSEHWIFYQEVLGLNPVGVESFSAMSYFSSLRLSCRHEAAQIISSPNSVCMSGWGAMINALALQCKVWRYDSPPFQSFG